MSHKRLPNLPPQTDQRTAFFPEIVTTQKDRILVQALKPMKNHSMSKIVLLGAVGLVLSTEARAQAPNFMPSTQSGRSGLLTVNFRSLDPSDTMDLSVNLGSVSPYQDGALTEATLIGPGTGLSSLELSLFFGGNLDNVKFSVTGFEIVGSGLSAERWLFLSSPGLELDRKPSSAQALTLGNIDTFYANLRNNGVEFGDPAAGGLLKANSGSYTSRVGANGSWGHGQPTEGSTGATFAAPVNVTLYELAPDNTGGTGSPGRELGTFTLSSAGVLTYKAVPEPSTLACLSLGGFLLWALRHRRPGPTPQR